MKQAEHVVQIIVDHRERAGGLIDELIEYRRETKAMVVTTNVEVATLPIGDIVCSTRLVIERKTGADFADSISNPKRGLMEQVIDLSNSVEKPILVFEGNAYDGHRLHPETIRSSIAAIAVGVGVPVISTLDTRDTAAYVVTMAWREQCRDGQKISIPHAKRTMMTMPQRQQYVVSSIGGGVGYENARRLLNHFGSVRAVMNASIEDLMEVDKIGKVTAQNIFEIMNGEYKA